MRPRLPAAPCSTISHPAAPSASACRAPSRPSTTRRNWSWRKHAAGRGFADANRRLAQAGITVTSRQPGLLPGRIVRLDTAAETPTVDSPPAGGDAEPTAYGSILGAERWQVAAVGHLCAQAGYWNQTSLEKIGVPWRPAPPADAGPAIVSAVVDDGVSKDGQLVERDRMGRIPVRFPFVYDPSGGGGEPNGAGGRERDDPARNPCRRAPGTATAS